MKRFADIPILNPSPFRLVPHGRGDVGTAVASGKQQAGRGLDKRVRQLPSSYSTTRDDRLAPASTWHAQALLLTRGGRSASTKQSPIRAATMPTADCSRPRA